MDAHFAALAEEFERLRLEERSKRPAFYDDLRQRIEAWRAEQAAEQNQPDESAE